MLRNWYRYFLAKFVELPNEAAKPPRFSIVSAVVQGLAFTISIYLLDGIAMLLNLDMARPFSWSIMLWTTIPAGLIVEGNDFVKERKVWKAKHSSLVDQ